MKQQIQVQQEHEILSLACGIAYSRVPAWYGATTRDLLMDVVFPKNRVNSKPRPAILWICGGAFCVEDRAVWLPELMFLARSGYVVASIDYRTCGEEPFPAALIDVKSAIRFLKANTQEFCIDPGRVCVMGESAGGTLACLAGLTANQAEFDRGQYLSADSSVQAVVDLYGITDLAAMQTRKADAKSGVPPWAFEGFAGGNTPGELARANAVNYVTKDAPPFLIFHGTADDVVPTQQSLTLYNLLLAESADATLYCVNDAEHGDALFFQEACTRRILSFLSRTLKTQE